jgi:hypothetical protein
MRPAITLRRAAVALSALSLLAAGGTAIRVLESAAHAATAPGDTPAAGQVVAMRRLSESQYRNTIADIFGPDIRVSGRFEPVVRPVHDLIASGARDASITPSGLEQFDAMARGVAAQVFAEHNRPQFMTCAPHDASAADDACARAVLAPLGRYLFRRPLSASELAFYVGLANKGAQPTHSFDKGLQLALSAMLISPNFLYIVETAEPDPAHPGQSRLDNYSRAARLSFVLWNTTPNEELLTAAEQGRLTKQDQLEAIAGRMVKSPRFEQGVRAFFADMLLFERFDNLAKDPVIFPYYNQEVAQAMPEQMLRTIVDNLVTHDGDYRQLFTTPRTVMTRSLGALYQTPVSRDKGWVPYEFAPGDDRAGLLGQAGFLAIYSQSGRSSATLRGRAVRELLLCEPVPNPPGNVNFTAVQDVHNKATPTARDRLSAHATDPECSSCHKLMDPVGLSLERFDGIGAFRSTENDVAIDPAGTMDGKSFVGATGLGQQLAADPAATECVAGRAMQYAMARSSDSISGRQVDALEKRFAADHYSIRGLFLQVTTMPEAYAVPGVRTAGDPMKISLATSRR